MAVPMNRSNPQPEDQTPTKNKKRKLKDFSDGSRQTRTLLNAVSILIGFFIWYLITRIPSINTFLASPKQVYGALISESAADGRFFKDISISLQRILIGFGVAFVASIPIASLWAGTQKYAVS
ncbi:MAG TPA: hypothetical protein PLG43_02365 [Spirochaetia bacterium]|nr:hypothetical protein [Spirochaetia bacterium]